MNAKTKLRVLQVVLKDELKKIIDYLEDEVSSDASDIDDLGANVNYVVKLAKKIFEKSSQRYCKQTFCKLAEYLLTYDFLENTYIYPILDYIEWDNIMIFPAILNDNINGFARFIEFANEKNITFDYSPEYVIKSLVRLAGDKNQIAINLIIENKLKLDNYNDIYGLEDSILKGITELQNYNYNLIKKQSSNVNLNSTKHLAIKSLKSCLLRNNDGKYYN